MKFIYQDNYTILEQIKRDISIQDVISRYLPGLDLKYRGNKGIGCCPFHHEKTPSFHVWSTNNRFYCFGCHEGGDQIDLVAKLYNTSIKEVAKIIASDFGLTNTTKTIDRSRIKKLRENQIIGKALKSELDKMYLRLISLEKTLDEKIKTYDDYKRYHQLVHIRPVLSWLIEEYLTFDFKKQIAVWRYVGGRIPWLMNY